MGGYNLTFWSQLSNSRTLGNNGPILPWPSNYRGKIGGEMRTQPLSLSYAIYSTSASMYSIIKAIALPNLDFDS